MDWDTDNQIRRAALEWLTKMQRINKGKIQVDPSQIKFWVPKLKAEIRADDTRKGIWKPRQARACLSIKTSYKHIYNDDFSESSRLIEYKYRAQGGYDHFDNKNLRLAMELKLPMLYFLGIEARLYQVELVQIFKETPAKDGILLGVITVQDALRLLSAGATTDVQLVTEPDDPEILYRTYTARQRLYQAEFRSRVMHAYNGQCTICHLRHKSLLDAAHIIPDAKGGKPEVTNGLSLCRIHHSAYDQNILGIDDKYRVHINREMLEEHDGPMLQYGFKQMNKCDIILPRNLKDHPDKGKLAERFNEFQNTH